MISEEWKPIVDRLIERTRNGELQWQDQPGGYRVSFVNQTVSVSRTYDDRSGESDGWAVNLVNEAGTWIDGCYESEGETDQRISDLHEAIRRQLLDVGGELRRLRENLG